MILKCVIISNIAGIQEIKFAITDAKLYDPVVTLSAHDNGKLLQELKPGFKRTKSLNKHQSKVTIKTPNSYLYYLIDPRFQVVNILFLWSLWNVTDRTVHIKYIFKF